MLKVQEQLQRQVEQLLHETAKLQGNKKQLLDLEQKLQLEMAKSRDNEKKQLQKGDEKTQQFTQLQLEMTKLA